MTNLNGCHNRRPLEPELVVQEGWVEDCGKGHLSRRPSMKVIPFTMSRECQYTHTELGRRDQGCQGCSWRAA